MKNIGSIKDMKARWFQHKGNIRHCHWKACGLTRHFGQCHTGDMEVVINNLQVTLVDLLVSELLDRGLKRIEDMWMVNMGTLFVGANRRNEVLSNNRRNHGGS